MAFTAGSIIGSLGLNIAPYLTSINAAASAGQSAGGSLRGIFSGIAQQTGAAMSGAVNHITSGISQIAGSVGSAGSFMSALASTAAGAVRGVVGTLTSVLPAGIGTVVGVVTGGLGSIVAASASVAAALYEITSSAAAGFKMAAREAANVGVSVGAISGSLAGVQTMAEIYKFLGRSASQAAAGQKEPLEAFAKLGISGQDVAANLNNLPGLLGMVADGVKGLGSGAERTDVAMQLLGRGGSDNVAMLLKGSAGLQQMRKLMTDLGVTVSDEQARMGSSFVRIQSIVDAAWQGIKNTTATRILQGFDKENEDKTIGSISRISSNLNSQILYPLNSIIQAIKLATEASLGFDSAMSAAFKLLPFGTGDAISQRLAQAADSAGKNVEAINNYQIHMNMPISVPKGEDAGQKVADFMQQNAGQTKELIRRKIANARYGGRG